MKLFLVRLRTLLLCSYIYYIILVVSLIYLLLYLEINVYTCYYNINDTEFYLVIKSYIIDGDKLSIELTGLDNMIGTYYFKNIEEVEDFKKKYLIGDNIYVLGTLSIPKNNTIPNTFNYKKYLLYKNINYVLAIESITKLSNSNNVFVKLKNYIINRINEVPNNEYLYAFILGNSKYLSSSISNNYKINTITHLFALSGLHVSIFASIISKIFKRLNEKLSLVLISIILFLLCFITSFTPSILRATIFYILLSLNNMYYTYIKPKHLLFVTFSLMIFLNPYFIYNLGFILSFTITYFLLISNENMKINNKLLSLLIMSIIATLGSFPIIINNFYRINIVGFINNLFFVPYVSYIVYPFTLITFIFPFLSSILNILTKSMEYCSYISSNILNISIIFSKMNTIFIIIYYILLMLIIKYKKKILIFLLILFMIFMYNKDSFNKKTCIYFIDVGQGDSTLIKTKNNKYILIDTGGKESYNNIPRNKLFNLMSDSMIPFINSIGIRKLDYLFITHGDFDHMGEAINLVENFKVEKVIFNCGEFNELEQDLIKVLDKKKIPYYSCIKELNIDNNKLYFLNNGNYGNENDNSSVIYTELNNYKFLFMGDASVEVEDDLIEKYNLQDIDVLKVGHHGSKTSSSKEFIDEVNPKYSVISVGKNNSYGHPNDSVLDNLEDSKIYRTNQNGSIMFKINKDKLQIETYSP